MEGPFKIGSRLDSFVHLLWSNNLRPGFEIMGNPGQFFQSNFTGTLLSKHKNKEYYIRGDKKVYQTIFARL